MSPTSITQPTCTAVHAVARGVPYFFCPPLPVVINNIRGKHYAVSGPRRVHTAARPLIPPTSSSDPLITSTFSSTIPFHQNAHLCAATFCEVGLCIYIYIHTRAYYYYHTSSYTSCSRVAIVKSKTHRVICKFSSHLFEYYFK